jgi:hypothetical protein
MVEALLNLNQHRKRLIPQFARSGVVSLEAENGLQKHKTQTRKPHLPLKSRQSTEVP